MAEFRINHDKVVSQANEMKGLSRSLGVEIAKLEGVMSQVKAMWKGPASETFQSKLSTVISNMYKTKTDIESVSNKVKYVADKIQSEDERLAEMVTEK